MAHDHILRRFYPERLQEAKPAPAKTRIQQALAEIKEAARTLPLQAALDVSSAIMDIETALADKPDE